MKVFYVSWNALEIVFHEILERKISQCLLSLTRLYIVAMLGDLLFWSCLSCCIYAGLASSHSKVHLGQAAVGTYSVCGLFIKIGQLIAKFKETGDARYTYNLEKSSYIEKKIYL